MSCQRGKLMHIDTDAETGSVTQCHGSSCYTDVTANRLLAETEEAGHLATALSIFHCRVQMHLSRRKDGRAGATLTNDYGQSFRTDYGGNFERAAKAADVSKLDFQQVGGSGIQDR